MHRQFFSVQMNWVFCITWYYFHLLHSLTPNSFFLSLLPYLIACFSVKTIWMHFYYAIHNMHFSINCLKNLSMKAPRHPTWGKCIAFFTLAHEVFSSWFIFLEGRKKLVMRSGDMFHQWIEWIQQSSFRGNWRQKGAYDKMKSAVQRNLA